MRTVAEINLNHLTHNFRQIFSLATAGKKPLLTNSFAQEKPGLVPMVKANAYGHGLVPIAKELEAFPETVALGVASVEEALELRFNGVKVPLWIFANGCGMGADDWGLMRRYGMVPILHSVQDVKQALQLTDPIAFHIKVNTGMNRLGLEISELQELLPLLRKQPQLFQGICTHFATPEVPQSKSAQEQAKKFKEVISKLSDFSLPYIHALSTSALFYADALKMAGLCNVARPGIGLYGYGMPAKAGLKPVMELKAKVLKIRKLKKGDAVGYGASFRAAGAILEAVIGLGYGDGFTRALSNKKLFDRKILGRVSMDLTSVEGKGLCEGEWLTIFGKDDKTAQHLAKTANTIVYELTTAVSQRVPRLYIGGLKK